VYGRFEPMGRAAARIQRGERTDAIHVGLEAALGAEGLEDPARALEVTGLLREERPREDRELVGLSFTMRRDDHEGGDALARLLFTMVHERREGPDDLDPRSHDPRRRWPEHRERTGIRAAHARVCRLELGAHPVGPRRP
jgi:hypothetical protein